MKDLSLKIEENDFVNMVDN